MLNKIFWTWVFIGVILISAAADEVVKVTLFDRSGGGMGLQSFFSNAFKGGKVKLPQDMEITVQKNGLPENTQSTAVCVIDEDFAPVLPEYKGCTAVEYAVVPVVIAVSAENPLENLNVSDLKRIYSGRLTDWKALGGSGSVRLAGMPFNSPQGRIFRKTVMQQDLFSSKALVPGSEIVPDMFVCPTVEVCEGILNTLPNAIVFGSWQLVAGNNKKGYKLLKINNVEPDAKNVLNGRYPLTVRHRIRFLSAGHGTYSSAIINFLRCSAVEAGLAPEKKEN